jgi:hypothetical protein
VKQDDPRGLKPVLRLTSAILTSFAGASFVGMTIVGSIVEEPEGWRTLRIVSGAAFVITIIWSVYLYIQWSREQRGR